MFKFDFWFKISSSFFFYPFYLAILSYQFLKLLFIEFSGVGIYCSVIKVLFVVVFQFSATTSLLYHIVSCLSTTFLFFSTFSFVVCCISFSENQFTMLCFPCQHLFVYFFYTIQTLSFFPRPQLQNSAAGGGTFIPAVQSVHCNIRIISPLSKLPFHTDRMI